MSQFLNPLPVQASEIPVTDNESTHEAIFGSFGGLVSTLDVIVQE